MIYEKNLRVLQEKHNDLYLGIIGLEQGSSPSLVDITLSKVQEPVVVYNSDAGAIYLNSRYNPSKEAEKFMEEYINMPNRSVQVMFGLSTGVFLREFLNKNNKEMTCIVFEPCKEIFLSVIQSIDITDILNDKRVRIVVDELNTDSFNLFLLRSLDAPNIKTNKYVILPQYQNLFGEQYDRFRQIIKEKYENLQIGINTLTVMGTRICYTGIQNMRYLPGCRSGMSYIDLFPKDLPVIIVSAGPSLTKNVELLKKAKGKALILVVDTAISKVMSRGIVPDMVISVDNQKILSNFEVDGLGDIPFLGDMCMSTDALDMVKPKDLIFYSSDSVVWDKLFMKAGSEINMIYSGGSVALEAMALAMSWGFRRIVLIGQDLAMTGNKQYADGEDISTENIKGLMYVKDIYGNDVPTKKDYFSFIRQIEDIAYQYRNIEIIDATEGGALIKHTTIMTLQEVIDKYCQKEYDIEEIIKSVPKLFVGEDEKLVIDALINMKSNLKSLGVTMKQAASECDRGRRLMSRGDFNVKELKKINAIMAKADDKYTTMDESTMVRKFVALEDYNFSNDVYVEGDDEIKEAIRMYEKSNKYYKAIADATPKIIEIVDDCLEKMQGE
ncbi:MAG: motility associated factor glycosyltransferase family protein [Lachnospiraceae bacterium]|nr:motility associated factor glycosyltransferase family protein [Lachnospiraceae bacterium]